MVPAVVEPAAAAKAASTGGDFACRFDDEGLAIVLVAKVLLKSLIHVYI